MSRHFLNHYEDYAAWISRSLALWDLCGRDIHNGCYEHLSKNGEADISAIRRHRVQARQVFSYASGYKYGWYDGLKAAESIFEFMCLQGWTGHYFIHKMDGDYKITDEHCDLYDHAFYLLAAASLYDVTGKAVYAAWIETIITAIDAIRRSNGGWAEDNIGTAYRRQNPHMHLFEVHLFLYETTKHARFLTRANESLALFKAHFFDAKHNRVNEFFNSDWSGPIPAPGGSPLAFEPGHAAEWVWLLGWYDRLTGQSHKDIRHNIFDNLARQFGPYLPDSVDSAGRPLNSGARRLWGQTEWIKAHIALHQDGYSPARDMLPYLLDHFMTDYLTPSGLWCDQFNHKGGDIAQTIPTSTQYHIIAMIAELNRIART